MNNIKFNIKYHLGIGFIALAFLILFAIQDIYSKQDNYKFDRPITNQENFPVKINCVIKDKKGFMWFGTDYGLHRFDGYNFKIYSYKFGDSTFLGNNMVLCLYDDDRYLWVGTISGLHRFDKITERFKEFKISLMNNYIYAICPAANNELWIGTAKGLNKFDKINEKYIEYNNVPSDTLGVKLLKAINDLLKDKNGYLWSGTDGYGLFRYDAGNKIYKNYIFNPEDTNSLSNSSISKILEDRNGNLWISTNGGGLNKFDKKTEKFRRFQHDSLNGNSIISDEIVSMAIDNDQKLWLGTPKGISIFDPLTNSFTNLKNEDDRSLPSDISYIYSDNTGIVWICSNDEKGFSMYNKFKWKFNYYENISAKNDSLNNNKWVSSVYEDKLGNFWIGSGNGIDILNKRKEKIRHLEHNPKDSTSLGCNNVMSIYRDKKNYMWIGTIRGPLDRYDADKDIFTHFYDIDGKVFKTYHIIEDKKENLWVGQSESGIRVFNSDRTIIKEFLNSTKDTSLYSNVNITDIFEDSKENIWVSSRFGLATIDLKTESINFYKSNPDDSTPPNLYVVGINEDENGYLWVGTLNGIKSFDIISKTFNKYNNIKSGGRDDIIGLMKDSKGNFWSTINKGITKFNLNDKKFTNYGVSDGFKVNGFNIRPNQYRSSDGELFFAGSKGLTSFYPDSIPQNKNIPTIVLTDFRIFNKEIRLDTSIIEIKKITISYKENFFSFGYAALDYTNPTKNQYAYMLEGIDMGWNNVGNQMTANYTNIEPGEYTFRVKGSNNDGLWNEEGTSVILIINPPWWETWWFKSCGAALIFLTAGYGFKKRIGKLRREKLAQEEFSRKLIQSQEEERKRIASELHDTIAHDILLTKSKALLALRNPDDNENLKNALNEISDMSSETINDVREISYNLHPHQLERLGFSDAIESIIKDVSRSSDIDFNVEVDNVDDIVSKETEINLYRVIQEGINNIIKHSGATEAELKVIRLENQIIISISDNGKGIDYTKETGKHGFGLSGIAERVKILKGELKIETDLNKGTILRISIPFKKDK